MAFVQPPARTVGLDGDVVLAIDSGRKPAPLAADDIDSVAVEVAHKRAIAVADALGG